MLKLYGTVYFRSSMELDGVAKLLSERLLGGLRFELKPGIRDEVPAMALERQFLGLYFVVYGGCRDGASNEGQSQDGEFALEIGPGAFRYGKRFTRRAGMGEWVAQLLQGLPGISVTDWIPRDERDDG